MKYLFKTTLFLTILAIFFSCEKDETRIALNAKAAPPQFETKTIQKQSIFTNDIRDSVAVIFAWSAANFGYQQQAVNYTLEFDKQGNDFNSPVSDAAGSNTVTKTYTVEELNTILNKLKLPIGQPTTVQVRIKATLILLGTTPNPAPDTISIPAEMVFTPYKTIINYPTLYMPGDYQGWRPDTTTVGKLYSVANDKIYKGYQYISNTVGFKLTSAPDWSHTNYGDGGAGKLSTDGGAGNLNIPAAGNYFFTANLNDNTWSFAVKNYAVIGSVFPADAGGWSLDFPFTYNLSQNNYTYTADLRVGDFKFRLNGAWDESYGDKEPDGILDTKADNNIKITAAGNYTITLDLSDPTQATYTITRN